MPKGRVSPREVVCVVCSALFVATSVKARCCSDECRAAAQRRSFREYGARNREQIRVHHRKLYEADPEKTRLRVEAYRQTEAGKAARKRADALSRERLNINPEKRRARYAVRRAIETGKITRQPCEECGMSPAQAHHEDYSKPLEVRWLCTRCHGLEHRKPRSPVDKASEPVADPGDVV